jgi:hypothetical protein
MIARLYPITLASLVTFCVVVSGCSKDQKHGPQAPDAGLIAQSPALSSAPQALFSKASSPVPLFADWTAEPVVLKHTDLGDLTARVRLHLGRDGVFQVRYTEELSGNASFAGAVTFHALFSDKRWLIQGDRLLLGGAHGSADELGLVESYDEGNQVKVRALLDLYSPGLQGQTLVFALEAGNPGQRLPNEDIVSIGAADWLKGMWNDGSQGFMRLNSDSVARELFESGLAFGEKTPAAPQACRIHMSGPGYRLRGHLERRDDRDHVIFELDLTPDAVTLGPDPKNAKSCPELLKALEARVLNDREAVGAKQELRDVLVFEPIGDGVFEQIKPDHSRVRWTRTSTR